LSQFQADPSVESAERMGAAGQSAMKTAPIPLILGYSDVDTERFWIPAE
jgi:hypothetical protein